MVLFAFLLFVLLKLQLYKFFISSTCFFTSSINFNFKTNCWNSSFVVGKQVLLIVLSSRLEIVSGSQLQEFTGLVIIYC